MSRLFAEGLTCRSQKKKKMFGCFLILGFNPDMDIFFKRK